MADHPEHLLRELLAVVYRDGGHYVEQHGLRRATDDAIRRITRARAGETDEATAVAAEQTIREVSEEAQAASERIACLERELAEAKERIEHLGGVTERALDDRAQERSRADTAEAALEVQDVDLGAIANRIAKIAYGADVVTEAAEADLLAQVAAIRAVRARGKPEEKRKLEEVVSVDLDDPGNGRCRVILRVDPFTARRYAALMADQLEAKHTAASEDAATGCSFCGKSRRDVKRLVANAEGVSICNECIGLCNGLLVQGDTVSTNG